MSSARMLFNLFIIMFICALSAFGEKYVVGSGKPAAEKKTEAVAKPDSNSKQDTLVITARIIEIPGEFAPNDLYNYVYIMKYRVLSVEKGSYEGKEILVGQYNPLIPRAKITDKMDPYVGGNAEKFEVGDKQKLSLIAPIGKVWNDAIDDEYFDVDLDKYFSVKTDIIK